MKAAIFVGPGELELQEIPDPHAGPGEVVIRVGANTVCGTDGRILRGEKSKGIDRGIVLGHEFSGYVTEVGEGVEDFHEGELIGGVPPFPACDAITASTARNTCARIRGSSVIGSTAGLPST